MLRALFVLATLLLPVLAGAQSVLTGLHPQPRAAYARAAAEPFVLAQARSILLDPASPAWSAALQLNDGLRARGRDTLAIGTWSPVDTSRGAVLLGICAAFINERLARMQDQRVEVMPLYPGPEGYVLDVAAGRVLLSGSDGRGLRYGIETFLQLLDLRGARNDVEACRIVDAPEFPVRWFYFNSYFEAADDFRNARGVWDRALRSRLNGVAFADGLHFSHLSLMPRSYLDSIAGMGAFAAARDLEIIPCVFPFGWSNYFLALDPDLASGLPVRGQRFVLEGDTARLLPRIPVSFPNGGFEERNGNAFPGFDWIDQPGKVSFADTLIRHSGATSIRFENIGVHSPEWGHGRMLRVLPVTPFTLFHVRAWVKTDAFVSSDLLRIVILDMKSKDLIHNELRIPPTTEWRQLDFTFNSLAADSIMIWSGSWQGTSGRVWWDDFNIEEVPFVNILRRPGAPVTIAFPTGTRVCREGIDVDSLFDPLRDTMYGPGVYSSWHTPPTMRIRPGGTVRNGDTLLVSYCHALNTYGDYGQVTATMSEDRTYELMARQAAIRQSPPSEDLLHAA
ncbi:MAG: hypothetical protein IPP94_01545 [Ignavibacteria bacterium]|nr:hypothetical protein [Ignavibacteria bacterium]